MFAQLEQAKLSKDEVNRQRHFDRMNAYQVKNDQKHDQFKEYKAFNLKEMQDKDTAVYHENMRAREDRADKNEQIKIQQKGQMEKQRRDGIQAQLKENEERKRMQRMEEATWAQQNQMTMDAIKNGENKRLQFQQQ